MKKICLVALSFVIIISAEAQTIKTKLDAAVKQFEKDPQLKHGLIGFSVIDAATGKPIYERNGEIGLAPASTQKIFTSIAAFEMLGKNYRYKTGFGIQKGYESDSVSRSALYVFPSGDPTFGSWRFVSTRPQTIIRSIFDTLKQFGIKTWLDGKIIIESQILSIPQGEILRENKFESQAIPDGWIWEDIGNYYGTGHYDLNWNENQYDIILGSGKKAGDSVSLLSVRPDIRTKFVNELRSASKGSGDNAYVYFDPFQRVLYLRGTIPCCVDSFSISGSFVGSELFVDAIKNHLVKNNLLEDIMPPRYTILYNTVFDYYSPPLDSLNYYFLKRSINLYGEALIRTIAKEKASIGSTEKGIEFVKDFYQSIGIEKSALGIIDGSGLSPQNRVTANSLTIALRYAKTRTWFSSFYYALPEINGIKMKSGSIGGVRSYAGYQKAANGKEYIFSIIVNNYIGSSSEINKKLFRILDLLK